MQHKTLADLNLPIYGITDMDYETYFEEERYLPQNHSTGMGTILWTDLNRGFYLQIGSIPEDRVLIYQHPTKMDFACYNLQSLIYFTSENALYRIFIPDGKAEKIHQDDKEFAAYPITNYVTMLLYPNPAFEEALKKYGYDAMPADHPPTSLYYLFDCRDKSLTEFHFADIGCPEDTMIDMIPLEEIRPLPKEESSSESSSAS